MLGEIRLILRDRLTEVGFACPYCKAKTFTINDVVTATHGLVGTKPEPKPGMLLTLTVVCDGCFHLTYHTVSRALFDPSVIRAFEAL